MQFPKLLTNNISYYIVHFQTNLDKCSGKTSLKIPYYDVKYTKNNNNSNKRILLGTAIEYRIVNTGVR